ncbi:hypothetical protein JCM10212_002503 [Sporobolomyces blumeae]
MDVPWSAVEPLLDRLQTELPSSRTVKQLVQTMHEALEPVWSWIQLPTRRGIVGRLQDMGRAAQATVLGALLDVFLDEVEWSNPALVRIPRDFIDDQIEKLGLSVSKKVSDEILRWKDALYECQAYKRFDSLDTDSGGGSSCSLVLVGSPPRATSTPRPDSSSPDMDGSQAPNQGQPRAPCTSP